VRDLRRALHLPVLCSSSSSSPSSAQRQDVSSWQEPFTGRATPRSRFQPRVRYQCPLSGAALLLPPTPPAHPTTPSVRRPNNIGSTLNRASFWSGDIAASVTFFGSFRSPPGGRRSGNLVTISCRRPSSLQSKIAQNGCTGYHRNIARPGGRGGLHLGGGTGQLFCEGEAVHVCVKLPPSFLD
jgi:hypothetical protein